MSLAANRDEHAGVVWRIWPASRTGNIRVAARGQDASAVRPRKMNAKEQALWDANVAESQRRAERRNAKASLTDLSADLVALAAMADQPLDEMTAGQLRRHVKALARNQARLTRAVLRLIPDVIDEPD